MNNKAIIIICVLFILIYIVPLNVRPLVIPDETRYAEISREIVESGDWIVPRLNGLRYFEKPILGYWLNSLSIMLIGENAFAIRLPTALAVGLSAMMLFFLVRRYTKDTTFASMAGYVFLSCLEIFVIGTFCILDSIFSMFVTASIIALFYAFIELRQSKKIFFFISAGIAIGLAFLTKGFLAFVIPVIIIAPFAIWQHQWKELLRFFGVTLIAALLTVLPWSIMIYFKEPDFWHYFFWVEHVNRFISPDGGQHPYPFWFFIPVLLIGTFPWTGQIVDVICKLKRVSLRDPLTRFSFCWFIFPFIFFSICRGKLLTYILPCFPPLIVLFILDFSRQDRAATAEKLYRSNKVGLIIIIVTMIGFAISQTVIPSTMMYRSYEIWKLLIIMAGILAYAFFLIMANHTKNYDRRLILSCLGPLMLIVSSQFIIPDKFIEDDAPVRFLNQYKDRINQNVILVSDNYLTPAVCWCYKRSDVFLLDRAGEFAYGLGYDDSTKYRLLNIEQFQELITSDLDGKHVILITSEKRYIEYKPKLPKPFFENIDCGFVFVEFAGGKTEILIDFL